MAVPQIVPISDDHPAIGVSWDDINEVNGFLTCLLVGCDTSSLSTDRMRYDPQEYPGCFRLPTEASEYAARAETTHDIVLVTMKRN